MEKEFGKIKKGEEDYYTMLLFPLENNALLMAFDPFTNEEIKELLDMPMDLARLHEYYKLPVMCLLRLKDSIDTWEKREGANGYFNFIERYIGTQVEGSEMMFYVWEQEQKR